MRSFLKLLMILVAMFAAKQTFAQSPIPVNELIKQGQDLSAQKKFTEAIAKYQEALKIEPGNDRANYEMAYALYSANKVAEAVPYLEKGIAYAKSTAFKAGAYSLLGSIYSAANMFPKSIEAYRNGIKADSTNQRLYYNLGIAQYRALQYEDAQESFLNAVKLDSTYAAGVRMYALSAFHQNKRMEALLGLCRFLMMDPAGQQSAEAFGNLQNILNGGSLNPEPGYKPSATTKAQAAYQNQLLTKALAGFATRRYASAADLLTAQLKAAFTVLATANHNYYAAACFYKLSQTPHLPTFVRMIGQKSIPANEKWIAENPDRVAAYEAWVKDIKTSF